MTKTPTDFAGIALLTAACAMSLPSNALAEPAAASNHSVGYVEAADGQVRAQGRFAVTGGSWADQIDRAASGDLADLVASIEPGEIQQAQFGYSASQFAANPEPSGTVPSGQVAQAEAGGDGDVFTDINEAARQSANPLGGDFMVLLNQWNVDVLDGDITDGSRMAFTHVFQPVIPIGLGGEWIWVTRPTFPIVYSAEVPNGLNTDIGFSGGVTPEGDPPAGAVNFDSESGLADIIVFSLVGTSSPRDYLGGGDLVLAGGATSIWPTATNSAFESEKFSAGPAGVAAFIGRDYTFGALAQHWWSYAGDSSAPDVNSSNIQYFYFVSFDGGWQIGGAPQIEIDWEQDSDDRWSVPIGLGVQKTHFFGKMPVRLGVEGQYYAVNQDTYGNEWRVQFTIAPIIPNIIGNLFK